MNGLARRIDSPVYQLPAGLANLLDFPVYQFSPFSAAPRQ